MNNCKNCGNKIFDGLMGEYKCYLKERTCVRSEIEFGCPDWSEKKAVKTEKVPVKVDGATFTPHVSEDGVISWTNDQGLPNPKPVKLTSGLDGEDGVGIASIEKTSTSGLVDTYTITYTNGDISTFTVTNGKDGEGGSGGGGVTSWNDLEDKPFGETEDWFEKVYGEFILTGTPGIGSYYTASFFPIRSDELVVGEKYKVVLGEYSAEITATYNAVYGVTLENEELYIYDGSGPMGVGKYIIGLSYYYAITLNPTNLYIYHYENNVHTIDEKFIPDTIARKTDIITSWNDLEDRPFGVDGTSWIQVCDSSITSVSVEVDFTATAGKNYKIEIVDAINFATVASTIAPCVTFSMMNLPYYKIGDTTNAVYGDGGLNNNKWTFLTSATIPSGIGKLYIYEETETVTALDEKYLPDSVALKTDIPAKLSEFENDSGFITKDDIPESSGGVTSWNELEDKPFGEEATTYVQVFSEDFSFSSLPVDNTRNVSIPYVFNPTEGKTYKIVARCTGRIIENECQCVYAPLGGGIMPNYKFGEDTDEVYGRYSAGIWFITYKDSADMGVTIELYEMDTAITTLDEKYLPDSVVLESELEEKGYQTEEQVTELINNALGVIENGTY